jgi:hypothetical protein
MPLIEYADWPQRTDWRDWHNVSRPPGESAQDMTASQQQQQPCKAGDDTGAAVVGSCAQLDLFWGLAKQSIELATFERTVDLIGGRVP